jgi:hypothetical protein
VAEMSYAEKIVVLRAINRAFLASDAAKGGGREERLRLRRARRAVEARETARMREEDALSEAVLRHLRETAETRRREAARARNEARLLRELSLRLDDEEEGGGGAQQEGSFLERQRFMHERRKLFRRDKLHDAKKQARSLDETSMFLAAEYVARAPLRKVEQRHLFPTFLILSKARNPATQRIIGGCVNRYLEEWAMRARDRPQRAGNDDGDDNGRSSSSSSDDEVSEVDDDADANPQKRKAREAAKKTLQENALSSEASIIRALKTLSASEDSSTVWSCLAAWRFLHTIKLK